MFSIFASNGKIIRLICIQTGISIQNALENVNGIIVNGFNISQKDYVNEIPIIVTIIINNHTNYNNTFKCNHTCWVFTAVLGDKQNSLQLNFWGTQAIQVQQNIQTNQALTNGFNNMKLQHEVVCVLTISNQVATPNINDKDEYKLDLEFCKLDQPPQLYNDQLDCNVTVKVIEMIFVKPQIIMEPHKFQSLRIVDETPTAYYRCKIATPVPEDGIIIITNENVVQIINNLQNEFILDSDINIIDAMQISLSKFVEKRSKSNTA